MINNNKVSFIQPLVPSKQVFILWIIFFCYSVCAALIFQKLLLPHLSSLQSGSGLITNDATYFDSVAISLAEKIKLYGWSSWQIYPANGAPGNVAILAALYVLFGYDPSLAIPINAAMHAFGGLMIFLLAKELANKPSIGTYAGIIASVLFVIFPSALVWYGQNHKDGYAIAGMLLTLLVWVKAINKPDSFKKWILLVGGNALAIILIGIVRPYSLKLLVIAALSILLITFTVAIVKKRLNSEKKLIGFFIIVIVMLVGSMKLAVSLGGSQSDVVYSNWQADTAIINKSISGNNILSKKIKIYKSWQWVKSDWLPQSIESYIEVAAKTRVGLIVYSLGMNAKSMIDEDIAPRNLTESIAYSPRALQIAYFAPFPSTWLSSTSLSRLVAVGEMFIYYLCIPGVFLLLFYNRKSSVLLAIAFASFFLFVYGFTQANLGTLYRYRHAYLFIVLMLGVLGWVTWLHTMGYLRKLLHVIQPPSTFSVIKEVVEADNPKRKEVIGSGFLVMALTLLCFVGFFLRDVMMAQKFGLGQALDSFFVSLLIPMFIVTVLCTPLGTAFIPIYLNLKENFKPQVSKSLLSGLSFWTLIVLLIICVLVYFTGPTLLALLSPKDSSENIKAFIPLLNLTLPLLLFSGVVILGNSLLNANGKAILTSSAQLVVPVSAIIALVLFGEAYGVSAVMFGMVIGQLLNLVIVEYYVKKFDASLIPKPALDRSIKFSPFMNQYFPLVISAFFVAAAAPIANFLATSMPAGGVSAFNLGNKVVLFVTGLVTATVSTVMLPYFSLLIAKKNLLSARRELSFFLLLSTFISIPISAILYIWSEPIVSIIFEGGAFNRESAELVSRVMQYAVIQLPFFVCNTLLLKFFIATKHVFAISVVAILGLLSNIVASVLLMPHMGVAGIALGTSISMLFTTALLILVLVRYRHVSELDVIIMFLNWMLFITLLISIHFQSIPSACTTIFAYVILLVGYIKSLKDDQFSGSK